MRYRLLVILPVIVIGLLTGCGKKEEKASWPAHITSMDGFADAESVRVKDAVGALNSHSDKPMITDSTPQGCYQITIKKVEGNDWPASRAGYATVTSTSCLVELSKQIFDNQKTDYIESVVWHELGHCSGLSHDVKSGEVMSPVTEPFIAYGSEVLTRFMQEMKTSAGL